MKQFFLKRWFLLGLLTLIPGGFAIGYALGEGGVTQVSQGFASTASKVNVVVVLFLMSWTLNTGRLIQAIRAPGPVLWATFVNAVIVPLLALVAMRLQTLQDLSVGVLIAGSVPCTMAATSVWTRKAHGNDAISLLVTVITNGACFLVVPFWLNLGLGSAITLDTIDLMWKLLTTALMPIVVGQLCRLPAVLRHWADAAKVPLGVVAQCCILVIVFWAAIQGGPDLVSGNVINSPSAAGAFAIVWASCIVIHVLAFGIALKGSILLKFERADAVGISFSGAQKTLPIGVYIATDLLADQGLPFAVFPMLMYHISQLFIDTMFIEGLVTWVEEERAEAVTVSTGEISASTESSSATA